MEDMELTGRIIGCAMRVHSALGAGFFEAVYARALRYELSQAGLPIQSECRVEVFYDRVMVGYYVADIMVGGRILVELKAVSAIEPVHQVQLVNYLAATGLETGLLINFGSPRLTFLRRHRTHRPGVGPEIPADDPNPTSAPPRPDPS